MQGVDPCSGVSHLKCTAARHRHGWGCPGRLEAPAPLLPAVFRQVVRTGSRWPRALPKPKAAQIFPRAQPSSRSGAKLSLWRRSIPLGPGTPCTHSRGSSLSAWSASWLARPTWPSSLCYAKVRDLQRLFLPPGRGGMFGGYKGLLVGACPKMDPYTCPPPGNSNPAGIAGAPRALYWSPRHGEPRPAAAPGCRGLHDAGQARWGSFNVPGTAWPSWPC